VSARRFLAGIALAGASLAAFPQDASLRLEMLTERIAKLHAQVGQDVLADRSRKALAAAIGDFDAGLKELKARSAGPEVRDNYILLGLLWSEYRVWALKPATRDNAKKLVERAEEVAWVAAKGARLLHDGRQASVAVALEAAHAATLSQRLGRLYLTQTWGVREESAGREIPAVTRALQEGISKLRVAARTAPEIETELHAAEGQLGFLLQSGRELAARRPSPTAREFVAKSADHILESMEHVVRLADAPR